MEKNEIFRMRIEDMSENGEGIGRVDGYTLFVKDTVIGDEIEGKVVKAKGTYGYGRLLRVLVPSADRVEPRCPVAGPCGGCQLQSLSYEAQLAFKERKVKNHLARIGRFHEIPIEPILGMDGEPFRYRNKAQIPFGRGKDGRIVTGFYAGRTHSVIEQEDCLLGGRQNGEILRILKDFMEEFGIEPYDETAHRGLVRHALIREALSAREIMVCLVINGKKLPKTDVLLKRLRAACPEITSICLNVNQARTNVILGERIINLYGPGYITDRIGDVSYRISPLSFYQVNPAQTKKLYETALSFAGLTGEETVWDLYCGTGTISLFLAKQAKQVYGVEVVPAAVENAKANAGQNGITNAEFYVGKAEEVLPEKYASGKARADVIVVDPPRKGCDSSLLAVMVKMAPKRIVYVSCDSATLARDLKVLCENGYELKRVQPVDMFPQTGAVETVVMLSKREIDSQKVRVEFSLEDMDMSVFQKGVTCGEIKAYVLEKFGLKVSNLYISQVKRKCGLEVGENYNLAKSENAKTPTCSPEKERAIRAALEHFGLVEGLDNRIQSDS
ncbi:MAG: 23S rRNA (uracil(1939)-C(5))-methyltransferase RlmD [Lachnospiraceae bacterium]|nr:23S rRNA (uracil(1939)-C(5))-methyltransferase RlmD [Lachnospiraceae bacterium]